MLVFHFSNGSGGAGILLLPLVLSLLSGDLLPALLSLLRLTLEFFGFSASSLLGSPEAQQQHASSARSQRPPPSTASSSERRRTAQQQRQQELDEAEEAWLYAMEFLGWLVFTFSAIAFFRFTVFLRLRGGWPALRQFIATGRFPPPRPRRGPGAAAGGPQQQGRRAPQQPRVTVEAVAEALQKVPTETHVPEQELQHMHVHELKARLEARGVDCSRFIEKHELLRELNDSGGSSATSCSICCDDYCAGDPIRVLPCQHRFHLECIDKWLLSATDFSRPPACPLCNAPLIKAPGGGAESSGINQPAAVQAQQQHRHHAPVEQHRQGASVAH